MEHGDFKGSETTLYDTIMVGAWHYALAKLLTLINKNVLILVHQL